MNVDMSKLVTAKDKAAADLAERRAGMIVSRLQGRLALGPDVIAKLDAIVADPATPWAMRETITNAGEWHRDSATISNLGQTLGLSETEIDILFEAAKIIVT